MRACADLMVRRAYDQPKLEWGGSFGQTLQTPLANVARRIRNQAVSNQSIATTLQLAITSWHGAGTTILKDALESIGCHLENTTQMSFPDNFCLKIFNIFYCD